MFQGLCFVILAAFVAFGTTLFMASNQMNARSAPAIVAPAATSVADDPPVKPATTKMKKRNKSQSTNRSSRGPTAAAKSADPLSLAPIAVPRSKTPQPIVPLPN